MKKYTMDELLEIMQKLRGENGCPWDRVQTHESIRKNMLEEAYEAIDALDSGDEKAFANELGDVLLQVVFHAQIASERGSFDFSDIINELANKLITRHSHIFGSDNATNADEALLTWEANKRKEKNFTSYSDSLKDVPNYLPALMRADKVQKKASDVGFDWDNYNDVIKKIREELDEVEQAIALNNKSSIEDEIGDLLFSCVNLSRFLKITAELSLNCATNKFINRFENMELVATSNDKNLNKMTLKEMDLLWDEVKLAENRQKI